MHRDPANFSPSPESFLPERWLPGWGSGLRTGAGSGAGAGTAAAAGYVHNEAAFIPFSYGPMNCVGKGLAMQEMRAVVCALLHRFEIGFADSQEKGEYARAYEDAYKDYFVATRPAVRVALTRRG